MDLITLVVIIIEIGLDSYITSPSFVGFLTIFWCFDYFRQIFHIHKHSPFLIFLRGLINFNDNNLI